MPKAGPFAELEVYLHTFASSSSSSSVSLFTLEDAYVEAPAGTPGECVQVHYEQTVDPKP